MQGWFLSKEVAVQEGLCMHPSGMLSCFGSEVASKLCEELNFRNKPRVSSYSTHCFNNVCSEEL